MMVERTGPPSRRILVVDDEPNVRLTLKEALEPLGYEIETIDSGAEAMDKLADPRVELVLLDLKMPGVDGLQVMERIERERPGLRVLIITAHGTVESAVASMKHGAVDFLQKPFSLEQIRARVEREMDTELRSREKSRWVEDHLSQARSLIRERRFQAAREHVDRVLAGDEGGAEALNLAGVLALLRGDRLAAQREWRLALTREPTYGPARRNLTRATHGPADGGPLDLGDSSDA